MLSFVIPVKDNEATIEELYRQISNQCDQISKKFEIIFIDYGSLDNTRTLLQSLAETYPNVIRHIQLCNGTSQSSAYRIGFHKAIGDIIFTMSASLKDDPVAIPRFLQQLEQGNDVVIGHKKQKGWRRLSLEKLLNKVVAHFTKVDLNELNSEFICYRSEVIRSMTELSNSNIQKKIPLSVSFDGYRVGKVSLKNRGGQIANRYNLLELSTMIFLNHHPKKPQRFIAGVSAGLFLTGLIFVFTGQITSSGNFLLTTIGSGLILNVIPLAVLAIVLDIQLNLLSNAQEIETLSNHVIVTDTGMEFDVSGTSSQNKKSSGVSTKVSG